MSKSSTNGRSSSSSTTLRLEDYAHSPVHYAVAIGDHAALSKIVYSLPRLDDPSRVLNESDSLAQEKIAEEISAVLDRRDNPQRETPLHLAVRLNDAVAVRILALAGASLTLQNAAGWCPVQEAILHRCSDITKTLVQQNHSANWSKWRRHLPRVVAVLHRMRDFYMEISFHFESSVVPFVGKFAPSDTYKIWKRDGNLRADTTLSGYDGLKTHRSNQSFLFLGDGDESLDVPPGSLLILNHDNKKIFDAFEGADSPLSDADIANYCNQTSVHRPGMDVTKAELVSRSNWRKQEKVESVGEWKARVYDVHNVVVSLRSRKITSVDGSEQILPLDLELEEDSEEGFLVAENPRFSVPSGNLQGRRHSSFVREERETVTVSRKSVDIIPEPRKRMPPHIAVAPPPQTKEKELVKSLRPQIWLTEQFPLKTEELLPLLDILANKVKAIRRMRELLTTTFPPGTFPVKVAIPVVPTVRVVITFTKFVELQPVEEFYTPMSSPVECSVDRNCRRSSSSSSEEERENGKKSAPPLASKSSSSFGWLSRSSSRSTSSGTGGRKQQRNGDGAHIANPFEIPCGYSWSSSSSSSGKRSNNAKKSKSVRKV